MRLAIDVNPLANPTGFQAGIFRYLLGLLRGFAALPERPLIRLYACDFYWNDFAYTRRLLDEAGIPFPLTAYRRPTRRPFALRRRGSILASGVARQDVFQYIDGYELPILPGRVNAFLVPDLTTLRMPEYHTESNIRFWAENFETIRAHADLVITYSEHARADLSAAFGIPPEKIVAIPLAADDGYRPLPEAGVAATLAKHHLQYKKYVLTVGTLEPRKNHITLFRAYAQYLQTPGVPQLPLVVLGANGWLYEPVLAEPLKLGIADRVRFLGRVEDLAHFYNGAAAFVYPSLYEGFGLPPLEAMACGTPVLAANATSLPEVVGDAGVLFDPLDAVQLAKELARMLTTPAMAADYAARGLVRAAKSSWPATAAGYLQAYRACRRV